MQGMVVLEKKQRKAKTKVEERDQYMVRWQQQIECGGRTGIDFTRTFWQRRPEEDMLSEED